MSYEGLNAWHLCGLSSYTRLTKMNIIFPLLVVFLLHWGHAEHVITAAAVGLGLSGFWVSCLLALVVAITRIT